MAPWSGGTPKRRLDLVQRRLLALAHLLSADADEAALLVGLGGGLGHVHHEVPIGVDFLRRRLLLQGGDGLANTLGHSCAYITGCADAFLVQRRWARYELVEEPALP